MKTLPHFDVMCDLLLNRRGATWNQFVLYDKKKSSAVAKWETGPLKP